MTKGGRKIAPLDKVVYEDDTTFSDCKPLETVELPSEKPSTFLPSAYANVEGFEDGSELEDKITSLVSYSAKSIISSNSPSTITGDDEFEHQLQQALGVMLSLEGDEDNTKVFAFGGNSLICKMFVDYDFGGKLFGLILFCFCWVSVVSVDT